MAKHSRKKKKNRSNRERSMFKAREPEVFNPALLIIFHNSDLERRDLSNETTKSLFQIIKSLTAGLKRSVHPNGVTPIAQKDMVLKFSEETFVWFKKIQIFDRIFLEHWKGNKSVGIRFHYAVLSTETILRPNEAKESQVTLSLFDILNIIQKTSLHHISEKEEKEKTKKT